MAPPKGHEAYNKNGEGGRPKIYTKEFIENEAKALEKWIDIRENIFLEDFCLERGYGDQRISEFKNNNDKFSEAIERFKIKQRVELFKGSLKKKYNFSAASLILGHYHNIYMKTEQKVTGSSTNPLEFIVTNIDGKSKDLVNEE